MAPSCDDDNWGASAQYYPRPPIQINGDPHQQNMSLHRHVLGADRFTSDGIDGNRSTDAQDKDHWQPRMQVDEALRQHCGISARRYFVVVIMDDGSPMTFLGLGNARLDNEVMQQFFNLEKYQRVMECLDSGISPVGQSFGFRGDECVGFPGNQVPDHRRMRDFDDWTVPGGNGRKRRRSSYSVNDDRDVSLVAPVPRKRVNISNSQDVWNFYEQRFKNCKQEACKLIAKAWVKAVEPKKQSTHPYSGGDEKAPDWWPKPWGLTAKDKVRHKEPDHLYKHERVDLLGHILRMVVEPNEKQHPNIQKLDLNVKKLKEAAIDALSAFFADVETPANQEKRLYLDEIFEVAEQEERFKKNEIDETTEGHVADKSNCPKAYSKNDAGSENTHSTILNIPVEQYEFRNGNGMPVDGQNSVHPTGTNSASGNVVPTSQYSSQGPQFSVPPGNPSWQTDRNLHDQQQQPLFTVENTSFMLASTQRQINAREANFSNLDTSYMRHPIDGLPRCSGGLLSQGGVVSQQSVQSYCGNDPRPHCEPWSVEGREWGIFG